MFFNHCFQFFYIHLCCNMFNIYKLFIYTQIEVIIFVQHISNSATHTCREVFTGFPKNCYTSSGHIFTAMVAYTFHNCCRTGIADCKTLACHTIDVCFTTCGSVKCNVSNNDIIFVFVFHSCRRIYDQFTAG